MKLHELIFEGEYTFDQAPDLDLDICDITIDAELAKSDTLFIYTESAKAPREKVAQLLTKHPAAALICRREMKLGTTQSNVLYVEEPRKALAYIYSRYHKINYEAIQFIGVTGTNGKTSTATLIFEMLKSVGIKAGFIGTGKLIIGDEPINEENYSMTTPDPQLLYQTIGKMQSESCTHIVMEVSSHALFYDKVAPIKFKIGIFTNLSHEHLDFHKTTEAYFEAKQKLFAQSEMGIFNIDDQFGKIGYEKFNGKKSGIGIIWDADVNAINIKDHGFDGYEYIYREGKLLFKVRLPLPGAYNVYNSLIALKVAIASGVKPCLAKRALAGIKTIDGRFECVTEHPTVIIDYAHTPVAFENILKSIKSKLNARQIFILVFGCGGERDRSKRAMMGTIAERFADRIILTSDNPRGEAPETIIGDIARGLKGVARLESLIDRKAAIEKAIYAARDNDVVAIIGKGHERYTIDATGYHAFDERAIIREALLKKRKESENED